MVTCAQVIEDVGSPEPRINPRWDPELGELASELEAVEDAVAKHVREVESTWGSGLDVKCERDKVRGYVFRVKKAHDKEIRKIARSVLPLPAPFPDCARACIPFDDATRSNARIWCTCGRSFSL